MSQATSAGCLGAKALMCGSMLIPNPQWGCYWDSRAVAKGLTEVTPARGL